MVRKREIGGFFELELPLRDEIYHFNAIPLWTGRACLNVIFRLIKPKKIYIPFYACDTCFEPMIINHIDYEFYHLDNQLRPISFPELEHDELFIYINYFGVRNEDFPKLIGLYGKQLVIDNTHSFFERGDGEAWSFNSARKFFGVPDGAYLYGAEKSEIGDILPGREANAQYLLDRLICFREKAYQGMIQHESLLSSEIQEPCTLSTKILSGIDYECVRQKRIENFLFLHSYFVHINQLDMNVNLINGPLCYPLLLDKEINKSTFHEKLFFVPEYWQDVLQRNIDGFEPEKKIAKCLLPLPIDQRYNHDDLLSLVQFVLSQI